MNNPGDDKMREIFKNALSSFEETPPPNVWDGIVKGLQRRKRMILWIRVAAAAALLLLFSIPAVLYLNRQGENIPLAEAYSPAIDSGAFQKPADVLIASAGNAVALNKDTEKLSRTIEKASQQSSHKKPPSKKLLTAEKGTLDNAESDLISLSATKHLLAQDSSNNNTTQSQKETIARVEDAKSNIETKEVKKSVPASDIRLIDPNQEEFILKPHDEKSWLLALAYGTTQGFSGSKMDYLFSPQKASFDANAYTNNLSLETGDFSKMENTTHSQPLTLGLNFSRQLSKHWAVESGLQFTRLGSLSKTYPDNNQYTEYKNQLTYIGFPVSVRFNLLNSRRFMVYLSQGIVLEKGLSADYETRRYRNDRLYDYVSGSFEVHGIQLSSLTSAGAGLKLSKNISIYIQPGMQLFFLNKTQPYSIRSSQAAWPALQTGLRVQL